MQIGNICCILKKLAEFKELMAGKGTQKTPKGCVSDVCCQNFRVEGVLRNARQFNF